MVVATGWGRTQPEGQARRWTPLPVRTVGLAVLVVAMVLAVTIVGPSTAGAQPEQLRPHVDMEGTSLAFADPTVLVEGGTAYAYSTNSIFPPINLQLSTSTDLHTWTAPREVMPSAPAWAWPLREGGEFWAPTVAHIGSQYVLYFAAHHREAPVFEPGWCIGHAVATSPTGPFRPAEQPLVCGLAAEEPISPLNQRPGELFQPPVPVPIREAGVIDPQVFLAPDGSRYLYFKAIENRYQLWGVPLSDDGTAVEPLGFGLVEMPETSQVWERTDGPPEAITVLENPAMVHTGAGDQPFTLLYSGDDWRTSDYATGLARCSGPLGPCRRTTTDQGWMVSRGGVGGPGGASVFTGFDGEPWLAYHSWRRGEPISTGRRLHVEPLTFQGGEPVLLRRPTTGSYELQVGPGEVSFVGTASDPDTGAALTVALAEGTSELGQVTTDETGAFSATFPAAGGERTYCASVLPVDDGPGRDLFCQRVTVPPPPIVASAPEPPTGVTP